MKLLYSVFILLLSTTVVFAQKKITQDKFFPEYPADSDMTFTQEEDNIYNNGIQYGAWITPVMLYQEDTISKLGTSQNSALLWLKSYLWNNSFLYVRGKYTFMANFYKENYYIDTYYHLPILDMAFIKTGFFNRTIEITLGRKYYTIGSGLVFNGKGDGIECNLNTKYVDLQLMAAYTGLLADEANPYDLSIQDYQNGSKRIFTGGTVSTTYYNQSLYILAMAQIDLGEDSLQRYHSQYYGAGLKGTIFDFWVYQGEYIYESGTSGESIISAMAFSLKMDFYIPVLLKPVIHLHYHFGSGDSDRNDYKTSMGNTDGADNGFISFGTFVAGYALRPAPGNLHALRMGFTVSPASWSEKRYLNRMSLTAKYSLYFKDKIEAGISYGEAPLQETFIGQGLDFSWKWRIFSDLSFYLTYAFFVPGEAYPDLTEIEHFVTGGINLSF